MSMSDPVADMLTNIRNAQMRGKPEVSMPVSKIKCSVAEILKQEGYIDNYEIADEQAKKQLRIILKYYQGKPVIEKIQRVSRPGLRCYRGVDELPKVIGGLGTAIISTSRGVMTDKKARKQGIGGEVLCIVA